MISVPTYFSVDFINKNIYEKLFLNLERGKMIYGAGLHGTQNYGGNDFYNTLGFDISFAINNFFINGSMSFPFNKDIRGNEVELSFGYRY